MKKTLTLIFIVLFTVSYAYGQLHHEIMGKVTFPETILKHAKTIDQKQYRPERRTTNNAKPDLAKLNIPAHLKSQQVRLDSIIEVYVQENDDKQVFLYDNQGRITSMIFSEKTDGVWIIDSRMDYTYTDNDQPETYTLFSREDDDSELLPWVRYKYYYDNDLTTKEEMYLWDDDAGDWALTFIDDYTYDSNKNLLTVISSMNFMGSLIGSSKEEYTYDDDGNNTMVLEYAGDFMGGWDLTAKTELSYNTAGLETLYVYSVWEDEAWLYEYKEESSYNGNLISEIIYQFWEEDDWTNLYKDLFEYSGNNLTAVTEMTWGDEGQWENDNKDEYTYDGHGNMVRDVYSEWIDGAWVYVEKTDITYDTSQSQANLLYPYYWESEGMGMVTSYVISDWIDGAWQLYSEATFYWSGATTTSTGPVPDISITTLFPNPAAEQITVGIDAKVNTLSIKLFDMTGRNVLNQIIENHTSFSVNHLHKGIYLIVIQADNELFPAQKLVIR